MYPLNDKDLDRLSREAAEQYDVELSTSGWERVQNRLNKELPVSEKRRRRFLLWLLLTVLITGGSLVWMLGGAPEKQNNLAGQPAGTDVSAEKVAAPDQQDTKATTAPPATVDQGTVAMEPSATPESGQPESDQPVLHQDRQPDVAAIRPRGDQPVTDDITVPDSRIPQVARNDRNKMPSQKKITQNDQSRNDRINAAGPGINKGITPPVKQPDAHGITNAGAAVPSHKELSAVIPSLTADPAFTRTGIHQPDQLPVSPETAPAAKQAGQKQSVPVQKWEFGIVAGPDFSHVKYKYAYGTGLNLGIMAGYRFSNRWQINTGIIYAKKYYKAAGEDFNPKYWNPGWEMQMATGNCAMLEIPLNVRYDFSYNQKRRLFASAGVSTWLMDNEHYVVYYKGSSGTMYDYPWNSDTNSDYFLSNLNISAGYEHNLGKHFSVQAEPYVKLPLKKVGWGSIDLSSYGILMTFKYKPGFGKRNKK